MKIICQKSDLQKSVNISLRAVPVRSTMPILECILINASTNTIRMISNDTDMGIETILRGDVVDKGIIAINAKMFAEVVRKLPDSEVTIETDYNMNVVFFCDKSKVMIPGQAGDDFTDLPIVERDESIEISQFTLRQIISQTLFSIASNENNKLMTGELFEIKGDVLRVVALDGHRISMRRVTLKEEYPDRKVIVPGKTLGEISKILSDSTDKMVSIYFTDKHVLFEFDKTTVVSRLIEGEYFSIDQMLSSDYETKIKECESFIANFDTVMKESEDWYDTNKTTIVNSDRIYILGYGVDYGSALEAQLKIGEMLRVPSISYEIVEYSHGPTMALNKKQSIFMIGSDEVEFKQMLKFNKAFKNYSDRVHIITCKDLAESDGRDLVFSVKADKYLAPIMYTVPFQFVAAKGAKDIGIDTAINPFEIPLAHYQE